MSKTIFETVAAEVEKLDLGDFRNTSDRVNLINQVASQLDVNGQQVVRRGLNTSADIPAMIKKAAPQFLQAKTLGRYVPRYPDNLGKSADELRHMRQANFSFLDSYTRNRGFVFKSDKERQELLDRLSSQYNFEWNTEKQPVARKLHKGMWCKEQPAKEVVDTALGDLLDTEETQWAQMEQRAKFRKKAAEMLGFEGQQLDEKQRKNLEDLTEVVQARSERCDTFLADKERVQPDVEGYRAAIRARQLHTLGHESTDTMSINEQTRLNASVESTLKNELGYGG